MFIADIARSGFIWIHDDMQIISDYRISKEEITKQNWDMIN